MESLGSRLRRLRVQRGLDASEIAKQVGVSVSTYRDWEGGRQIRGEPYAKLADVFGVSLSQILLGGQPDKTEVERELATIEAALGRIRRRL